ncbi:MAG TPA: ComEC/Rec2 family competence protein [Planctomycetota bacterium]|nr:ComEC/Rec2 family competence protein [Planctomycetota bacterium]
MTRALASRPLLVAGPAAVAGVASAALAPGLVVTAVLALLACAAARRAVVPALAAAAFAAGYAAGARDRAATAAMLATVEGHWPRAPPGPVGATLRVTRCGEDPFHGRAWLEGLPPEGPGLRCTFAGTLPGGVGPGAVVRVAGRCRIMPPPGNPGETDRRLPLARRGVGLLAELRTADNVEVLRAAPWSPAGALAALRRKAAARLHRDLPADVAPVAVALLLGDRTGLSDEDRLDFERTGTSHVLAISGMHVLLLAAMVHALLRAAGLGPRAAAGVTFALALAYVPVAGAGAPVRRAVSVLAFHALALVRGRPPDAGSSLGGAALLLALLDPSEMLSIGSQLSFLAAAGILWLAGPWQDRWSARYRLLRRFPAVRHDRPVLLVVTGYLLAAFPVSLAAWLATLSLVARAFGVVTPYAVAVNVLAAPLVSVLLAAVALVALAVPGAAPVATAAARALRGLLALGGSLPASLWVLPPPPVTAVVLWILACVLLRWRPLPALAGLATAIALAVAARPAPPSDAELSMLDVGHGQAVILRSPDGWTALVDGGSRTRPGVARAVLLPALRALGIVRIDLVVVTHADADHWNALPLLLRRFPVGALVTGPDPPAPLLRAAAEARVPWSLARAGAPLFDGPRGRLVVLAAGGDGLSENDTSVVLLLEAEGGVRALLPADREERGLRGLIRSGLPRSEILVAPHHGARCEEAQALGRAVQPRLLLVSSAPGFPNPQTLERYGAPEVIATFDAGAITVRLPGRGAPVAAPFRRNDRATIRAP